MAAFLPALRRVLEPLWLLLIGETKESLAAKAVRQPAAAPAPSPAPSSATKDAAPDAETKATAKAAPKAAPSAPRTTLKSAVKSPAPDPVWLAQLDQKIFKGDPRLLKKVVWMQALAIPVLIGLLLFAFQILRDPNFYYVTPPGGGDPQPVVGLDTPNLGTPALLSWAVNAASSVMTMSFFNLEPGILANKDLFTDEGWASFVEAVLKSAAFRNIQENQLIVTAVPNGAAVVVYQTLDEERQEWVVQVPLLLTYQSGNTAQTRGSVVTMTLVRVSTLIKPQGIGISKWQSS